MKYKNILLLLGKCPPLMVTAVSKLVKLVNFGGIFFEIVSVSVSVNLEKVKTSYSLWGKDALGEKKMNLRKHIGRYYTTDHFLI